MSHYSPDDDERYYLGLLAGCSIKLDSEGLALPNPAPDVIRNIEAPAKRHHYEVSWRCASQFSRLLSQWDCWLITLKWRGDADTEIPHRLEKAARGCILALCFHGWNDGDSASLLSQLPPLPPFRFARDESDAELTGETAWSREERVRCREEGDARFQKYRDQIIAYHDKGPLRHLRKQLDEFMLMLKYEAPRPLAGPAPTNEVNPPEQAPHAQPPTPEIPPDRISKPMAIKVAAKHAGFSDADLFSQAMRKGQYPHKRINRQNYVFDLLQFPLSAHLSMKPSTELTRPDPNSPGLTRTGQKSP